MPSFVFFFLFISFTYSDNYYYYYYEPLEYGPDPVVAAATPEPTPMLGARVRPVPIEGILLFVLNSLHGSAPR